MLRLYFLTDLCMLNCSAWKLITTSFPTRWHVANKSSLMIYVNSSQMANFFWLYFNVFIKILWFSTLENVHNIFNWKNIDSIAKLNEHLVIARDIACNLPSHQFFVEFLISQVVLSTNGTCTLYNVHKHT